MTRIKRHIQSSAGIIFYVLCLAIPVAAWWATGAECGSLGGRKVIVQVFRLICDAGLILIPYWWLPRRYRWLIFLPLFIIPLWCVAGVMYYRFWGDVPGLTALGLAGNFNGELMKSIEGLWRWSDILLVLMPMLLLAIYLLGFGKRVCENLFSLRLRLIMTLSGILLFLISQCLSSWAMYRHSREDGFDETILEVTIQRFAGEIFTQTQDLAVNGRVMHFLRSIPLLCRMMNLHIDLTPDQREKICQFIEDSDFPVFAGDSVLAENHNKNLILIMVESLNAYVIDTDLYNPLTGEKQAVAPEMRRLRDSEGTVSALNVMTQVSVGGSGDGQLMTNTGLLPLADFSTAIALGSTATFPSLCRAFEGRDNIVIFGDDASIWNERSTFTDGYGFEKIMTNHDYLSLAERMGGDAALFDFAEKQVGTLRQPFFMELLTVSMHTPFTDDRIPETMSAGWIDKEHKMPELERNYLRMVNYFDSSLGRFIASLKRKGIYDDTVIVIVSDHAQELATSSDISIENVPMVFMAVNTGLSRPSANTDLNRGGIEITERAGQIDIYPTILHLMGSRGWRDWKGVGRSLLTPTLFAPSPNPGQATESTTGRDRHESRRRELSEQILRSDFFSGQY